MSPNPDIKRVRSRITGLKRRRRFVPWRDSHSLAAELREVLDDLMTAAPDPCAGAELVVAFFETDEGILGHCDDSSGVVGAVYSLDARETFLQYAVQCEKKGWLADLVLDSNREDNFGVRDTLIDCAASYLPENDIRLMIGQFQQLADAENDKYKKRHWLFRVESLARQIGDAALFEKTRRRSWGELNSAACVNIAQVYYETGDAVTAHTWLARIPAIEGFGADERDDLLIRVHGEMGDRDTQVEVAGRMFRRRRCKGTLDRLVAVMGESERNRIIDDAVVDVLGSEALTYTDASFLIFVERWDDAERYLLDHAGDLDGDIYDRLLPMAEAMEATGRPLAASAVYRALIDSILKRARSTIYHHAVRYLRKLNLLATQISDWGPLVDHDCYFEELREKHAHKSSLWARFNKSAG